jgi:hypothetical protein
MKNLFHKLLCFLFIHSFHELDSGNGIKLIGCRRCPGRWEVDTKHQTMEPIKEVV